jgi:NDP-sugar pyrophosphorylase family protein
MNVIIPLGGIGNRFQKEGYDKPKPFIDILGKEMLLWVTEHLNLSSDDSLVMVFNPAFMDIDKYMADVIKTKYPSVILVELPGPTRGAAETVLFGLKGISQDMRNRPCMLCDGDSFYTVDIVSLYRKVSATHNASFTFVDTQPKPIYSYVTVTEGLAM